MSSPRAASAPSRRAGVVIPLFSLRSQEDWGIGEIPDLVAFSRWAEQAGFSVVQMLPVNDVSPGQSSPYAARSAFALDPAYLSLGRVVDFHEGGGLAQLTDGERSTLEELRRDPTVNWEAVRTLKSAALERCFVRFHQTEWLPQSERAQQFSIYLRAHSDWLEDHALFVAIHDEHHRVMWTDWPAPLRDRDPAALDEARRRHAHRILAIQYAQWQLDLQWHEARDLCESAGVALMGDLPFVVAGDSADVWARAREFRMDATAGVPPDAFSADGQDWGLPVYRWDVMAANDYEWMRLRARRLAELFRLYRIDHVIGLYRTFFIPRDGSPKAFIPADEESQIRQGERLIQILALSETPDSVADSERVIAEDLGVVPPFVRVSLQKLSVPGYRVQRWEKDDWKFRDPATWPAVSVATTGTHDTDSLADWYDALSPEERHELLKLPGLANLAPKFDAHVRDSLLRLVFDAPSELVLVMFQDVFGARERINLPGTVSATNWVYRMPMPISSLHHDTAVTHRLHALCHATHRLTR